MLVIDCITPNYISLTQYPNLEESDEAFMRNPQVVFEIGGNRAEPIYYFNDSTGEAKQVYVDTAKLHYWPKAKREIEAFCIDWFQDLHKQGYFEKAKK